MATQAVKILAVSSGKGGVGKTTVTLNIARQLSLAGFRTLIVDFDIHNKGATCLFMKAVADSQVQSITYVMGKCTTPRDALELASQFPILKLDYGDNLFLIPAARPDEMVKWENFVCEVPTIVEFLKAFLHAIAESNRIDVVLIDCYGGVDRLTISAAGVADDFVIINEPDVITFAGTLLLYKQLENTYEGSPRPPRVHFVINRISGRYSFRFLQEEYQKHLAQLAVDRGVLAYLPFDKLVFDTFGDYPFFSELLPEGLYAKKIRELIARLWPEPRFTRLTARSRRVRERIYRRTAENPFADPERIFQAWKSAPAWALLPITALIFLYLGPRNRIFHIGPIHSISFFTLRAVFYPSLLLVLALVVVGILFEPFQITRWLLRKATYEARRRKLIHGDTRRGHSRKLLSGQSLTGYVRGLWDRAASCAPALIGFVCFCTIALTVWGLDLVPHFRNVAIWRGQIEGFYPGGNYYRLILARQAVIKPGTDMSKGHLEDSDLVQVLFPRATLSEEKAHGANLEHAKLLGAKLMGADLSEAKAVSADFAGADASGATFQKANLTNASFWGAVLTKAVFKDATLYKTDFRHSNLEGANFFGAIIKDPMFEDANLKGAVFSKANFDYLDGKEVLALVSHLCTQNAMVEDDQEEYENICTRLPKGGENKYDLGPTMKDLAEHLLDPGPPQPHKLPKMPLVRDLMNVLQRPAEDTKGLGQKTDLVELLLIRGDAGDFEAAATALNSVRRQLNHTTFQPGEKVQREGITCVLSVLLSILSQDGQEKENLTAWQRWLSEGRDPTGRSRQLTGWEWGTWDRGFPAGNYSREQNMEIRAIQLSAGTASDSQNNLTCDEMALWFDSVQPCPHPARADTTFNTAVSR